MNMDFKDQYDREEPPAGRNTRVLAGLLIFFIIAISLAYWWRGSERSVEIQPVEKPLAPQAVEPAPRIEHPLPDITQHQKTAKDIATEKDELVFAPVPPLGESDDVIRGALEQLAGNTAVAEFLILRNFVRKVVVTIDNLPGRRLPQQYLPVKRPAGRFKVQAENEKIILDSQNYARYTPFIDVLTAFDSEDIAALYVHFYPLFQDAYEELGYPDHFFNDRMIAVIDGLLKTPEVEGPVVLIQPNVFYYYADPELEALSAGQKLLLRMGPQNASRVKQMLQEVRQLITARD